MYSLVYLIVDLWSNFPNIIKIGDSLQKITFVSMRITLLFLILTSLLPPVQAQGLSNRIRQSYQLFKQDSRLKHAVVSFTVLDSRTGSVIFADQEQVGLPTASTLKTITSATAFHVLGSEYRYRTELIQTGEVDAQGQLDGDIIIRGSGDPSLASDRFAETKEQVVLDKFLGWIKAAGIRRINGRIIGSEQLFGAQTAGARWNWQDMGSYYGAGVSGLNWRENTADLIIKPGSAVGKPTQVLRTQPDVSYLKLVNDSKTGSSGSGDRLYPFSAPYSSLIFLRGTYALGLQKKIQLSLPDAAFDAALRLQLRLEQAGISVGAGCSSAETLRITGVQLPEGKVLGTHESPVLSDLIYWFNQKSINLYGESLLKTMALKWRVDPETELAADKLSDFWTGKLGLEKGSLHIVDGSGLSPENRVTGLSMTRILASAARESWFPKYRKSFPLYNGMTMKSGTIGGVLGYTGYHDRPDGSTLVFTLLVNNYTGSTQAMRQHMFKLLDVLK